MRKRYDFSKARRNPYAKRLKKSVTIRLDEDTIAYFVESVTIRLDEDTIAYFKDLAADSGIPYQTLINLYLRDCAASERRLSMRWRPQSKKVSGRGHG